MSEPAPALGMLDGSLLGSFAVSITPIYFTFILGVVFCFMDILKLDFVPAISVIIQYVCLPALMFNRLAFLDPKDLDLSLLGADFLSKAIPLVALFAWWAFFSKLGRVQSIEWVITLWMLATLPNTVLIGDQILTPMFTDTSEQDIKNKTTTIIFAQSLYWYNFVILLYEIRELFIEDMTKLPPPIDPGPSMLSDELSLTELAKQQEMEKSSAMSWEGRSLTGWEPNRLTWEQQVINAEAARPSWEVGRPSWSKAPYNVEHNDYSIGSYTPNSMTPRSIYTPSRIMTPGPFMTPSRMTPNYRFTPRQMIGLDSADYSSTPNRFNSIQSPGSKYDPQSGMEHGGVPDFNPEKPGVGNPVAPEMPPVSRSLAARIGTMMFRVFQRMLQVPLMWGSVLGFIWSINRWHVPNFLQNSVLLCSSPTVGLAMILVGMVAYKFYKGAKGFVPCGQKLLWLGFFLRFVVGPIVMYVCTLAFRVKGYLLSYAILQVIVPQGSMTFALAQIYGCKLEVITPAIYIQMIVFVPVILADLWVLSKTVK